MLISAGNVRQELQSPDYRYHQWNIEKAGIEDPAQAIAVPHMTVPPHHNGRRRGEPIHRGDLNGSTGSVASSSDTATGLGPAGPWLP